MDAALVVDGGAAVAAACDARHPDLSTGTRMVEYSQVLELLLVCKANTLPGSRDVSPHDVSHIILATALRFFYYNARLLCAAVDSQTTTR